MTPRLAPVLVPVAIVIRARWTDVATIARQLSSMSAHGTADAYLTHDDMSVRLSMRTDSDTIRSRATLHGPSGLVVLEGRVVTLPRGATDGLPASVMAAVPGRPLGDLLATSGTPLEPLTDRLVSQVRTMKDGCMAVELEDGLEDPSPIPEDGSHAAIAVSSMSCGR
jgi:hypothetical protein